MSASAKPKKKEKKGYDKDGYNKMYQYIMRSGNDDQKWKLHQTRILIFANNPIKYFSHLRLAKEELSKAPYGDIKPTDDCWSDRKFKIFLKIVHKWLKRSPWDQDAFENCPTFCFSRACYSDTCLELLYHKYLFYVMHDKRKRMDFINMNFEDALAKHKPIDNFGIEFMDDEVPTFINKEYLFLKAILHQNLLFVQFLLSKGAFPNLVLERITSDPRFPRPPNVSFCFLKELVHNFENYEMASLLRVGGTKTYRASVDLLRQWVSLQIRRGVPRAQEFYDLLNKPLTLKQLCRNKIAREPLLSDEYIYKMLPPNVYKYLSYKIL